MLKFVELKDGTYRLTYVKEGNPSFTYEGRFQQIELADIPEKEKGFKIEMGNDEK